MANFYDYLWNRLFNSPPLYNSVNISVAFYNNAFLLSSISNDVFKVNFSI